MSNNEATNTDNNAYTGRDDILAQFQELINNYDVDQCLAILNVVDWNIDQAVQLYFQQHQQDESNTQTGEPSTTTTTATTTTANNNTVSTATYEDENDIDMDEYHVPNTRKVTGLLPDVYANDKEAVEYFVKEYHNRFGKEGPVPPFYVGTLLEACNQTLFTPKTNERKQLLIYIHVEKQIFSNLFNTQLLCNKQIIEYLNQSNSPYLIWPWDVSEKKNETYLFQKLDELKTFYGYQLNDIENIKMRLIELKQNLPCLIVLENINKSVTIANAFTYNETPAADLLYFYLLEASDQYETKKANELKQEQEREMRQRFKEEQDLEFKRALELDKAKKDQKQKEEQLKKQIEQDIIKRKADSLAKLPQEPSPSPSTPASTITTIRFRKPTGEFLIRKFLLSEKLNVLLLYLDSLGFFHEDHKLLQQYPKRDLIQENHESTLEQLKLYPQETLIIEQR